MRTRRVVGFVLVSLFSSLPQAQAAQGDFPQIQRKQVERSSPSAAPFDMNEFSRDLARRAAQHMPTVQSPPLPPDAQAAMAAARQRATSR